jgi:hypothetical protein
MIAQLARAKGERIPGAKLSAVVDVNVEAARRVASELEVPVGTGDHRELLEDQSIQAIVICSSTDTRGWSGWQGFRGDGLRGAGISDEWKFCASQIEKWYGTARSHPLG